MTETSRLRGGEGYGACIDAVRVERRGKSSPSAWRHVAAVNSIRSNTVEGIMLARQSPRRWLERIGNGTPR